MAIIWNSMNNYLSRVIQPLAVFNKYTDALIMGFVAHFCSHYECSVQNLHFKYRPCQIFPTLSFDWCFQKLKIQRHKKHKIMHGHLLGKERAKKEKKREFGKKREVHFSDILEYWRNQHVSQDCWLAAISAQLKRSVKLDAFQVLREMRNLCNSQCRNVLITKIRR